MKWYYLSLVEPECGHFIGACIVKAYDEKDAVEEAVRLCYKPGEIPGGEIMVVECPEPPPKEATYKLMDREEVECLLGPVAIIET